MSTEPSAIENKQVALEQQIQADYEAERIRRLARGQADAVLIDAEARADGLRLIAGALDENEDLLTYRYIEELTPNIRVMLLPNDAPFILPLEELLESTETLSPTLPISPMSSSEISLAPDTAPQP